MKYAALHRVDVPHQFIRCICIAMLEVSISCLHVSVQLPGAHHRMTRLAVSTD